MEDDRVPDTLRRLRVGAVGDAVPLPPPPDDPPAYRGDDLDLRRFTNRERAAAFVGQLVSEAGDGAPPRGKSPSRLQPDWFSMDWVWAIVVVVVFIICSCTGGR